MPIFLILSFLLSISGITIFQMQFQQMEISTMPQVEEIQMLDSKENRNQTRRILQLH